MFFFRHRLCPMVSSVALHILYDSSEPHFSISPFHIMFPARLFPFHRTFSAAVAAVSCCIYVVLNRKFLNSQKLCDTLVCLFWLSFDETETLNYLISHDRERGASLKYTQVVIIAVDAKLNKKNIRYRLSSTFNLEN